MGASSSIWRHPTTALRLLVYSIADVISPKASPLLDAEKNYLDQLISDVSASPLDGGDAKTNDDWARNLAAIRGRVLNDNPREFLRWPVILRTMFVGFRLYVLRELYFLRNHGWPRWKMAIRESTVGRPYRFPLYPTSSSNLIHYAYHLAVFEQVTGQRISELDAILEFGGGYGGMCRVVRNLGRAVPYVIFDLPYFSALQRYYLQTNGIGAVRSPDDAGGKNVVCISNLADLRVACRHLSAHRNSLLIATWSLSEAPVELREQILAMTDKFGCFLIAYQSQFAGVNNEKFFADWAASRPHISWRIREIPHLPGSVYLIGIDRRSPIAIDEAAA